MRPLRSAGNCSDPGGAHRDSRNGAPSGSLLARSIKLNHSLVTLLKNSYLVHPSDFKEVVFGCFPVIL